MTTEPAAADVPTDRVGVYAAASAYLLWGLLPVYLKSLHGVAGVEVLLCRVLFSLAFLSLILGLRGGFGFLREARRRPVARSFLASAMLISFNWFLYIWAVGSERVVDASFGYFINPLVNVLLGALVLRERLRAGQWLAVATAATGVSYLTWQAAELPWIGLSLAITFGTYGLLRKTASLGAMEGLALETMLLAPFALAGLGWLVAHDASAFAHGPTRTRVLLACAGPVTSIPLVLFAVGARRIPLSLLGLLQYIGPTLQLLLGVYAYGEPMSASRLTGFAIIWSALAIYSIEGLVVARRNAR